MDEQQPMSQQPKKRRGGLTGGLIVLALGIILLLQNYYPQISLKLIGPVILIIVGIGILYNTFRG